MQYLGPGVSGPDSGSTSLIPRTHKTPDNWEGPILLPKKTIRAGWPEPQRSVHGIEALEPRIVTPSFAEGDVFVWDSWLLHRANSNYEQLSKIGIVQVFCRADCVRLTPAGEVTHGGTGGWPVARGGKPVAGAPRL